MGRSSSVVPPMFECQCSRCRYDRGARYMCQYVKQSSQGLEHDGSCFSSETGGIVNSLSSLE